MTPETFNRRPIPAVPGWNTPDDGGVVFSVTYDDVNDRVVITASQPVMGSVIGVQYEISPGGNAGSAVTIVNATTVWIENAYATLGGVDTDLIQVDVYTAGPTLIGTWTGVVLIAAPVAPAITTMFKSYVDIANGFVQLDCPNYASINAMPYYRVEYEGIDQADIYGVEVTFVDAGVEQFTLDNTNIEPSGPGVFGFASGLLVGRQVASAFLFDDAFVPLTDPSPASAKDFWLQIATFEQVGDSFTITFASTDPDVWPAYPDGIDRVLLVGCAENGGAAGAASVFDPLGPNAGLNPGGLTVVQWDATQIVVTDVPALTFPVDLVFALDGFGSPSLAVRAEDWPP